MFPVIIDNMMNLELLFRATALGGDARFKQDGTSHALTTRTNHFRTDYSSYHLVDYNPTTGAVIKKQTNQGLADESAWARGQAWGLYGFTMSYRETNDARFLAQATRIADFYTTSARMPADGVPYFDFDAPIRDDVPDYRDASAGAIAASGLFELARYETGATAENHRAFAIKAVRSLSSTAYRAATGTNQPVPADAQRGQLPAERRGSTSRSTTPTTTTSRRSAAARTCNDRSKRAIGFIALALGRPSAWRSLRRRAAGGRFGRRRSAEWGGATGNGVAGGAAAAAPRRLRRKARRARQAGNGRL